MDRGWSRMRAWVDERVTECVVLVSYGWGKESNCNLMPAYINQESILDYPTWKSVLCTIRPVSFDGDIVSEPPTVVEEGAGMQSYDRFFYARGDYQVSQLILSGYAKLLQKS